MTSTATSLAFFDRLRWIDGKPLLPTIQQYRRDIFTRALDSFGPDGLPVIIRARRPRQEELEISRFDPCGAL
jgi:hypothetical protein